MPAEKDKRDGKTWRYRKMFTLPSGQRKRITGTPAINTKAAAEAAERAHVEAVLRGQEWPLKAAKVPRKVEVYTIKKYSEIFLECYRPSDKPSTKRSRRQLIKSYIVKHLGSMKLNQIRQSHIDGLVSELVKTLSRKTVNNITSALSSMMRYAVKNRVIKGDVILGLTFKIKAQQKQVEAIPVADVQKVLLCTSDPTFKAAILLAADAGLRIGEIRALTWADVHEDTKELVISKSYDRLGELTTTKGWKERRIPLGSRLMQALLVLPQSSEWIISKAGKPMGYSALRRGLRRRYDKAGVVVAGSPWHGLRHTFGTQLAASGVPVHTIKELMGHVSIETTLRYMHSNREAKHEAISGLAYQRIGNMVATEQ